jgi:hypothetical protein
MQKKNTRQVPRRPAGKKECNFFIDLLRQVRSTARRIFKMARFPRTEPEVIALAQGCCRG